MSAVLRVIALLVLLGTPEICAASGVGEVGCASDRMGEHEYSPQLCCPNSLLTGCPDNYCRKPIPRVVCLPCGQCDDYCRKRLPRTRCLPGGECDNYCRKPWPQACRPLRTAHYNCAQE